MANKRVFQYLALGPADSTHIVKTPNGPANYTIWVKSTTANDAATLAVNASFVAEPENADLISIKGATGVQGDTTVTEFVAPAANKYPYLQLVYNATATGDPDIITEVYLGFY